MADPIPAALAARIQKLPVIRKKYPPAKGRVASRVVIERFALFVDTHRDQPHIGTFHPDIHRGQSRPTLVDYQPDGDLIINAETGDPLERHPKHMFITEEWFGNYLVEKMMEGEPDPRDGDGIMATSHLRDSRAKVYLVKTFRQIVVERYLHELGGGS